MGGTELWGHSFLTQVLDEKAALCVNSGFHRGVNGIFDPVGG
jgi:hypothetical protein